MKYDCARIEPSVAAGRCFPAENSIFIGLSNVDRFELYIKKEMGSLNLKGGYHG
jgi:hypothetical protein